MAKRKSAKDRLKSLIGINPKGVLSAVEKRNKALDEAAGIKKKKRKQGMKEIQDAVGGISYND